MQRIVSILLILCVVLQTCSKLSIIAGYQLNKEFIAKVLCINKKVPQSGCEGKCYLNKKLAQAEQHEHSPTGNLTSKAELLFVEQIHIYSFAKPVLSSTAFTLYLQHFYSSPASSVFIPPKV